MDEIKVRIAQQYGVQRMYPACTRAELFCELVGSKTLTLTQIQKIKALGYTVSVVPEVTEL